MRPAVAVVKMPTARPRDRSNLTCTVTVETSVSEPCPRNRIPPNPIANQISPLTNDMLTSATPNIRPIATWAMRTPYRSISFPTVGSIEAPASVPTR